MSPQSIQDVTSLLELRSKAFAESVQDRPVAGVSVLPDGPLISHTELFNMLSHGTGLDFTEIIEYTNEAIPTMMMQATMAMMHSGTSVEQVLPSMGVSIFLRGIQVGALMMLDELPEA